MRKIILALLTMLCAALLTACSASREASVDEVTGFELLSDKSIGVVYDTSEYDYICNVMPGAKAFQYTNLDEAVIALQSGGIDAVSGNRAQLELFAQRYTDLVVLNDTFNDEHFCFGVKNGSMLSSVNETISKLEKNGKLGDIRGKWISGSADAEAPDTTSGRGVLLMGIVNNYPMAYSIDGEYDGMEIDIAKFIAKDMNRQLKTVTFEDKEAMTEALKKGTINLMGGGLLSEDKVDGFSYSDSYYVKSSGFLIKQSDD